MTSNHLFSKTRELDFRREISWFAVYTLVFFFLLPIGLMLGVENIKESAGIAAQALQETGGASAGFIAGKRGAGANVSEYALMNQIVQSLGMGVSSCVLGVIAAAEAYHQFGWLHRKRETDFYHALPQSRKQIFSARLLNGVLTALAPYTLCMLIAVIYALAAGASAGKLAVALLPAYGLNIFFFLLIYMLCITAVLLTGNALTGFLGMGVLNGFFPALAMLLSGFASAWFRTFVTAPRIITASLEFSPAMQLVRAWNWYQGRYYMGNAAGTGVSPAYWQPAAFSGFTGVMLLRIFGCVLALFLLLAADWLLYQKRPLEKAGEAMVFPVSEPVIRIGLVILCGMGGAMFFYVIRTSFAWAVFGMLAGVLISHCIIEIIYRNDFRSLFGHKLQLAACAVFGVLLLCVFRFDWFGYDRYLPDVSRVAQASAVIDSETWPLTYYDMLPDGSYRLYYRSGDEVEKRLRLNDEEDIADIRQLAQLGIAHLPSGAGDAQNAPSEAEAFATAGAPEATTAAAPEAATAAASEATTAAADAENGATASAPVQQEMSDGQAPDNDATSENASQTTEMKITWVLKNGRTVQRRYNVPLRYIAGAYANIYASGSYKQALYPVLSLKPGEVSEIRYTEDGQDSGVLNRLDSEQRAALLAAYQKDLKRLTLEECRQGYPVAELTFTIGNASDASSMGSSQYHYGENFSYVSMPYPVYSSFTETCTLLTQYGVAVGQETTVPGTNETVSYSIMRTEDEYGNLSWADGMLTDPADVALVRKNFVSDDSLSWNQFGPDTIQNLYITISSTADSDGGKYPASASGSLLKNAETDALAAKLRAESASDGAGAQAAVK